MQEFIDASLAGAQLGFRSAKPYTNNSGMPLFGYSHRELPRAVIEYARLIERHDFPGANTLAGQLRVTLDIEEQAGWVLRGLFTNSLVTFVARAATKYPEFQNARLTDRDMTLILYAEFCGKSVGEIRAIVENADKIYAENWALAGGSELQDPPPEKIGQFYSTLPFPIGSLLYMTVETHLGMALRAQPVLLAKSQNVKRVIDVGGNDGIVTSAMAAAGIPEVILAEQSSKSLAFAKWRDEIAGIRGVQYLGAADLLQALKGTPRFDLAVCTEVLEHLSDVEGFLGMLSQLVRPGGLLFLSASFGLVYPSHLLSNRKYCGHEFELLAKYGFERLQMQTSVRLSNVWLFRRTAATGNQSPVI